MNCHCHRSEEGVAASGKTKESERNATPQRSAAEETCWKCEGDPGNICLRKRVQPSACAYFDPRLRALRSKLQIQWGELVGEDDLKSLRTTEEGEL